MFGRAGQGRLGELSASAWEELPLNPDVAASRAFRLEHDRAGVVSLAVASFGRAPATEIAVTTGPGPAPSLDGNHIVFGRVEEGLSTVAFIARTPTFGSGVAGVVRSYNALAQSIGDERARHAQAAWTRPVDPVIIVACGRL